MRHASCAAPPLRIRRVVTEATERLEQQGDALAEEMLQFSFPDHPTLAHAPACCLVSAGCSMLLAALQAPAADVQHHAAVSARLLLGGAREVLQPAILRCPGRQWDDDHPGHHLAAIVAALALPGDGMREALPPSSTLAWLSEVASSTAASCHGGWAWMW
jgi:hypothetical protein